MKYLDKKISLIQDVIKELEQKQKEIDKLKSYIEGQEIIIKKLQQGVACE